MDINLLPYYVIKLGFHDAGLAMNGLHMIGICSLRIKRGSAYFTIVACQRKILFRRMNISWDSTTRGRTIMSLNWSLDPDIDQTDASGTCIPKEQDE